MCFSGSTAAAFPSAPSPRHLQHGFPKSAIVLISRAAQSKRIAFGGMQIERSTYSRMEDFTMDVAAIEPATPACKNLA